MKTLGAGAFAGRSRPGGRSGVTLVEVMLASSILAVLTVLAAQVVDAVADVWLAGRGRSESFATARALLSRVRTDLENGVMRSDLPGFPNPRTEASTELELCSRVQAAVRDSSGDYRRLTYIEYRLEKEGRDAGYVVRMDTPFRWSDSPFGSAPKGTEARRRMCGNVLGFKHRFVVQREGEAQKAVEFENSGSIKNTDTVGAVRVSLAVADQGTFRLLESANLLNQAVSRFQSLEPEEWEKELVDSASTLPPAARRGVRIFHQAVPLVVSKVQGRIPEEE